VDTLRKELQNTKNPGPPTHHLDTHSLPLTPPPFHPHGADTRHRRLPSGQPEPLRQRRTQRWYHQRPQPARPAAGTHEQDRRLVGYTVGPGEAVSTSPCQTAFAARFMTLTVPKQLPARHWPLPDRCDFH
jgi:hypothetical protein